MAQWKQKTPTLKHHTGKTMQNAVMIKVAHCSECPCYGAVSGTTALLLWLMRNASFFLWCGLQERRLFPFITQWPNGWHCSNEWSANAFYVLLFMYIYFYRLQCKHQNNTSTFLSKDWKTIHINKVLSYPMCPFSIWQNWVISLVLGSVLDATKIRCRANYKHSPWKQGSPLH